MEVELQGQQKELENSLLVQPDRAGPRAADAAPKDALELGHSGDHSMSTFGGYHQGPPQQLWGLRGGSFYPLL